MADIKKSFNFRNGFQIDDDNVVVNANGLVGIGTTKPETILDVVGNMRVSGIASLSKVFTSEINVKGNTVLESGSIGIATFSSSGIVTATVGVLTYYGDGGNLLNLPTSQWLDVDVGIGFTSVYAQGNVGIRTNDPRFALQIGGNNSVDGFAEGVGINRSGNILATGIITASSGFSGNGSNITNLNATNVTSGTLSNDRIPVLNNDRLPTNPSFGNVTATQFSGQFIGTVTGNVVGIASTALSLLSDATISVAEILVGIASCGLTTSAKLDIQNTSTGSGTIGINTTTHRSDLHISKNSGISSILLTSSPNRESLITLGRNFAANTAGLRYGFGSDTRPYSNADSLDIVNYTNSSGSRINYYLTAANDDSKFHWLWGSNPPIMTLTRSQLIVGSGVTSPIGNETLRVAGILTVTGATNDAFFSRDVYVNRNLKIGPSGSIDYNFNNINFNNEGSTGVSTFFNFNVRNYLAVSSNVLTLSQLSGADMVVGDWTAGSRTDCVVVSESGIGIGTTSIRPVRVGTSQTAYRLDILQGSGIFGSIGVGTTSILGLVDFSNAGAGTTLRYMLVPRGSGTTGLAGANARFGGAILFDSSDGTFKGHDGSNWLTFSASSGGTVATQITLVDETANDTTCFPIFAQTATGNQIPYTDSGALTYNANNGTLSATTFSGALAPSNLSASVPINKGGTNSTATPTNGGIAYGTGTAYAFTSAGSSGQVLQSNGASAPTWVNNAPSYTQNAQSGAYTLQSTDKGKYIDYTPTTGGGGSNSEITLSSTLAASPGQQVIIYVNNGAAGGALPAKLIPSGVNLYYGGATGSVTRLEIDRNGVLTLLCVGTDTYVAYGNNITLVP